MRYYSDELGKAFDTEKECLAAEKTYKLEQKKKQDEAEAAKKMRADRAAEVECALKEANEAYQHYHELLNKFIKDYGSFHCSFNGHTDFDDLFNWFFHF